MFLSTWPRYLVLSCLFAVAYLYLRQKHDSEREMRRLDEERAQFEQRTTEAVLQRLQAQIEPHFLFNTLAHVKRLYQIDRAAGSTMLDQLMRYLAEALPQMREPQSTIGREIALTEAYIGIQQIRMGRRLRFHLEVDEAIASARMPPMMLLTLVAFGTSSTATRRSRHRALPFRSASIRCTSIRVDASTTCGLRTRSSDESGELCSAVANIGADAVGDKESTCRCRSTNVTSCLTAAPHWHGN